MKLAPLIATVTLTGFLTVWDAPLKVINPSLVQASAQELSVQQKIELLTKSKGQIGSGDQLRRFFFGDLEPIGIQPGGAGHVVNLYNKANNVTFSYCSTYDVIVAIKKGKVAKFEPNEVK
ncbi:hypothetical protein I8752_21510 [Nostocaceae cyanobacterium CENA369]|uniref:Uncharacterized protein n=1 Tax=Dendronalium phyllosphericum CENA369 TaxID=1725256 RepID=A0A8J7I9I9_9NOST|nr:hypothetical protein [Dendronalium phyllosphericum]MBH8575540.1 hypothetical protein [Dendronalium phyllosphericum CENA369]